MRPKPTWKSPGAYQRSAPVVMSKTCTPPGSFGAASRTSESPLATQRLPELEPPLPKVCSGAQVGVPQPEAANTLMNSLNDPWLPPPSETTILSPESTTRVMVEGSSGAGTVPSHRWLRAASVTSNVRRPLVIGDEVNTRWVPSLAQNRAPVRVQSGVHALLSACGQVALSYATTSLACWVTSWLPITASRVGGDTPSGDGV